VKPPQGAGRFIAQIVKYCQPITPVGVYEDSRRLCINFGLPIEMYIPPDIVADHRDELISDQVMSAIARQLPSKLRGDYDLKTE